MAVQGVRSASRCSITFIAGGVMYIVLERGRPRHRARRRAPRLHGRDAALPKSIAWFCARGVHRQPDARRDASSRATCRAARSRSTSRARVRPRDYVLGKLAGLGVLMAILIVRRPAAARVHAARAVATSSTSWSRTCRCSPKALAIGALATLRLRRGAARRSRRSSTTARYALALWAAYYLIGRHDHRRRSARVAPAAIAALDLADARSKAIAVRAVRPASSGADAGPRHVRCAARRSVARSSQAGVAIAIVWFAGRSRARRPASEDRRERRRRRSTAASGTATCSASPTSAWKLERRHRRAARPQRRRQVDADQDDGGPAAAVARLAQRVRRRARSTTSRSGAASATRPSTRRPGTS